MTTPAPAPPSAPDVTADAIPEAGGDPGSDDGFVVAAGLGLATGHGPVFHNLSFSFSQGALAVISGPSGTGRSALLLAIGGRMRGLTGSLRVAGFDSATHSGRIRETAAIARVSSLVDLEGRLSVADSITERALTDAVPAARGRAAFARAETLLQTTFDRSLLVEDLPALDRTLLAVGLATLRPARLLLLDDADLGLSVADQRELMTALLRVTTTGLTVVATTIETEAVPPGAESYALPRRS